MSEAIFLTEVGLLVLFGRLLGEIMQRYGQSAVMGQLLAGLIFGPSVVGILWPGAELNMIDAISQLGILMLLLLTGMETDLRLVRRVGRPAITAALAGVAVPLLCGFALGEFLPGSICHSLRRVLSRPSFSAQLCPFAPSRSSQWSYEK